MLSTTKQDQDELLLSRLDALFEVVLGRPMDPVARMKASGQVDAGPDAMFSKAVELICCGEYLQRLEAAAIECHLALMHRARTLMVRRLLPQGRRILDLGGANAPLYMLGYPHAFERMVMVDLPPDERHELYRSIEVVAPGNVTGVVTIQYCDMTNLHLFDDESFDLVWSGQSIEHVDLEAGRRMVREAWRVLAPGGHFCLDTPNRAMTRIHTRDIGGGFIHPEHQHEYEATELRQELEAADFSIVEARGVCEMPSTCRTGHFAYEDFVLGNPISESTDDSYILYFACAKPSLKPSPAHTPQGAVPASQGPAGGPPATGQHETT